MVVLVRSDHHGDAAGQLPRLRPPRACPACRRAGDAATPTAGEAQRALIERSARALGVATAADLRDYSSSTRRKPTMPSPIWRRTAC
ncbi:DNA glycosylase AlkZ-like family protein [Sphingomonas sp. MMS24-JH45]